MSDRYEALERLQRLRESGALTDEEFQAEKRRLLGHDASPAVERVTEVDTTAPARSRTPLYVMLGVGGLALAIGAGLLIGRNARTDDNGIVNLSASAPAENAATMNLIQGPPPPQDVRTLTKQEQLGRAFAAAFGGAHGQAPGQANGQAVVYKPGTILWIGDRAVLISAAKATQDCEACAGTLAVHYLKASGDKFEVTGAWPDVVSGPGRGLAPKWKLTNTFTSYPAIYEEGSGMGQGYVCTSANLIELAPSGPVKSGPIPLHYDNEGAVTDPGAKTQLDGKFVNVRKGVSFDLAVTGSRTFTETWLKRGDHFEPQGEQSKALQC
jgi:hypothetical protein